MTKSWQKGLTESIINKSGLLDLSSEELGPFLFDKYKLRLNDFATILYYSWPGGLKIKTQTLKNKKRRLDNLVDRILQTISDHFDLFGDPDYLRRYRADRNSLKDTFKEKFLMKEFFEWIDIFKADINVQLIGARRGW